MSLFLAETLPFTPDSAAAIVDKSGSLKLSPMLTLKLGTTDPVSYALVMMNWLLTFLGAAALVILIYAGLTWIRARGNSEEIEKAKHLIRRAAVGLGIILAANAASITLFYIIQARFYA